MVKKETFYRCGICNKTFNNEYKAIECEDRGYHKHYGWRHGEFVITYTEGGGSGYGKIVGNRKVIGSHVIIPMIKAIPVDWTMYDGEFELVLIE